MSLLIRKEGIFTSIQGVGAFGLQRFGVNPRGAMDRTAARIANLMLGNDDDDLVLELHFPGPEIEFTEASRFAVAGADLLPVLNGAAIANWKTHAANADDVLGFEKKIVGSRAYIAVEGGLRLPEAQPRSFSTVRLKKGSLIERNAPAAGSPENINHAASRDIRPAYRNSPTVRVLRGGEFDHLDDSAQTAFTAGSFTVTNDSNRMGFRLSGPEIHIYALDEMVSAAVTFGTIQLLPDGQLIVLMADHQTSGGYPRVGNIISADLPLIAQLGPGDAVNFKLVEIGEAEEAAIKIERDLRMLRDAVRFGRYW